MNQRKRTIIFLRQALGQAGSHGLGIRDEALPGRQKHHQLEFSKLLAFPWLKNLNSTNS